MVEYKISKPDQSIAAYVERFWAFQNHSDSQEIVVIPDGRIDIIYTISKEEPFRTGLIGIETVPSKHAFPTGTIMFGISLNLLAVEYLLQFDIAHLVNGLQLLPDNFWGITPADLDDFDLFCKNATAGILREIGLNPDDRKKELFKLIYSSNGEMTVNELATNVHWTSRQINRYFNQKFGLSLKKYCNILRFKASFPQIKEGKFYPEQNFADQAHFIREVKKYSGVTPKELFKNKNDRFIQFSALS